MSSERDKGSTLRLDQPGEQLVGAAFLATRPLALLAYYRDGVEVVPLKPGVSLVFGREAPSDVLIADPSLSRSHARFELGEEGLTVEDLGSTNGTFLKGERVDGAALGPGDEVTLGSVLVCIQLLGRGDSQPSGLASHGSFCEALEQEIVRAKHFGDKLGVVLVRAARKQADDAHLSRWCAGVQKLLRPVDSTALYSSSAVELLLPRTDTEQVRELCREITEASESHPQLLCGVALFPEAATTAGGLLEACRSAASRAVDKAPVQLAHAEGAVPLSLRVEPESGQASGAVVLSKPMKGVFRTVDRIARSQIPVLLKGETGCGKEVVAKAIHERGPRCDKPLISVNCGAIPSQLVESTLFGHEKGAFTGASQQQKGVFESADGGSVLLDEVGELPQSAQVALLRVLETKRLTRVGSSKELAVDARVIAATHRDLEAMCEQGSFRRDLLFRLNAMTVNIPPLRERGEEIAPLTARFLADANEANGCDIEGIDPAALQLLHRYDWPGNVGRRGGEVAARSPGDLCVDRRTARRRRRARFFEAVGFRSHSCSRRRRERQARR